MSINITSIRLDFVHLHLVTKKNNLISSTIIFDFDFQIKIIVIMVVYKIKFVKLEMGISRIKIERIDKSNEYRTYKIYLKLRTKYVLTQ